MTDSGVDGCICCSAQAAAPLYKGLLQCQQCTHVWADVRLSNEQLSELYAQNYFRGSEYLDYSKERTALEHNFRARLRDLMARHRPGEFLWEIGAAYGFFLRLAADAGFRIGGCEISAHAAEEAEKLLNLPLHVTDYREIPAPRTPYDLVCMWDTIEHLAEPHVYVEKAFHELRPGGTIAISTGDISSLMARLRKEQWRLIHPPTHLHYFTAQSIRTLLERTGFCNVQIKYPWFWRSADAVAYRILAYPETNPMKSLYSLARKLHLTSFSFPVNTWDLMTVYATRGEDQPTSRRGRSDLFHGR